MTPEKWRARVTASSKRGADVFCRREGGQWVLTGDPLEDAFHACALRFQGYRWTEVYWPALEEPFAATFETIRKTGELPADVLTCFAAFFLLQRFVAREQGWFTSHHEFREHGAWLYLHLYHLSTPQPYRSEEYERTWQAIGQTERERVAGWVRRWLGGQG